MVLFSRTPPIECNLKKKKHPLQPSGAVQALPLLLLMGLKVIHSTIDNVVCKTNFFESISNVLIYNSDMKLL